MISMCIKNDAKVLTPKRSLEGIGMYREGSGAGP
jgi:hypothetical protein